MIILCRSDVQCVPGMDLCCWTESAWIEVALRSGCRRKLLFGCFYRPPHHSTASVEEFVTSLESSFSSLCLATSDVVLVGDFNAMNSCWCPDDCTNLPGRLLELAFLSLGLHQCIDQRTHLSPDGSPCSLLDLVLTTNEQLVASFDVTPPLGSSDYLGVLCHLHIYPRSSDGSRLRKVWCYEKADFTKLNKLLDSSDWSSITAAPDIDSAWSSWLETFLAAVSSNVPSKVVKQISPKLPWMSTSIEAEIKKKHALFRAFKHQPCSSSWLAFNQQHNLVTRLLRKAE